MLNVLLLLRFYCLLQGFRVVSEQSLNGIVAVRLVILARFRSMGKLVCRHPADHVRARGIRCEMNGVRGAVIERLRTRLHVLDHRLDAAPLFKLIQKRLVG